SSSAERSIAAGRDWSAAPAMTGNDSMREARNTRGAPRSRSQPSTYQCPSCTPATHGSTARSAGAPWGQRDMSLTPRPETTAGRRRVPGSARREQHRVLLGSEIEHRTGAGGVDAVVHGVLVEQVALAHQRQAELDDRGLVALEHPLGGLVGDRLGIPGDHREQLRAVDPTARSDRHDDVEQSLHTLRSHAASVSPGARRRRPSVAAASAGGMLRWERGTVKPALSSWPGVDRLEVELEDEAGTLTAIAYRELTGRPRPGETVLLNTNAVRRELGTGGDAMVVARPDVLPHAEPIDGHMVKARYTPMQTMVDAIDDPAGEHYETLRSAKRVDGMPVVVADLHSSLPALIAGIRAERRTLRIAYVHSDAAALPAAYSRSAARLREADLLSAVISAGQSFGGDLEAVTVHSALLGAKHVVGADVTIVIQGPGNLGTGPGWGFSGVQSAEALHAAAVLGGQGVATLRV